jgi:hypothetical protein
VPEAYARVRMANDARHFPHRATYDDAHAYLAELSQRLDLIEAPTAAAG